MKAPITIKNIDIDIFDTLIEVLNNGNPSKKRKEECRKKFNQLRKEYQTVLDKRLEEEGKRPDENHRLSPNPININEQD